jgi:hypothetical protein
LCDIQTGGLLTTVTNPKTQAIEYSEDDGDLTILGRIMAQLPVDIHISKMIALGHVFGVLEDCIIMGEFPATFNKVYLAKIKFLS